MQCNRFIDYHIGREWRDGTINEKRIKRDIIVIGASAGGVPALQQIFAEFPSGLPAAVGVVLHRGAGQSELVQVLGRQSTLSVIEPAGTVPIRRGTIYLAPPDHHLLFERGKVAVRRGPREHSTRPSVDPLFRSAAESYGSRVVGLLLTGCGEDGVSGLISITKGGGLTLVQDPDEAYMPYMPLNALRYDDVAGLVSLDNAASVLASLAHGDQARVSVTAKR
jgi:two-component system, chemotaxis family, protein-glutamate methylesterase/glutaminase